MNYVRGWNNKVENAAHDMVDRGYAAIFGQPSSKQPFDPRDRDILQEQGLKSGVYASWQRHDQVSSAVERATERGIALNLGIRCGVGGLAVIDVDTAEAVRALSELATVAGAAPLQLTTLSPGKQDQDGRWVHKDGGHVWVRMPEYVNVDDYPATVTLARSPDGEMANEVDLKLHTSWVLCPPSERDEGSYTWAGDPFAIYDAPQWLIDRLEVVTRDRRSKKHTDATHRNAPGDLEFQRRITEWAESIDLDELLRDAGWTSAGTDKACGCEVWTRPGNAESSRSAILHETGCRHNDADASMLHLWTTGDTSCIGTLAAARGITRLTPLHIVCAVRYNGDMSQTTIWEGLATKSGGSQIQTLDGWLSTDVGGQPHAGEVVGDLGFLAPAPTRYERPALAGGQNPPSDSSEVPSCHAKAVPSVPSSDDWELPSGKEATERFSWDIDEVWFATDEFTLPGMSVLEQWNGLAYFNRGKKWVITPGQLYAGLVFGDVPADIANAVVELWGTNLELAMSYYKDYLASLSRTELREQYGTF